MLCIVKICLTKDTWTDNLQSSLSVLVHGHVYVQYHAYTQY